MTNHAGDAAYIADDLRPARRSRRGVAVAAGVAAGALLLLSHSAWAEDGPVYVALKAAGLLAIAAGVLGRVWASLFIAGRKGREVVRSGPYAVVRHPLYAFSAIAAAGIGLFHGSVLLAAAFLAAGWLGMAALAREEERALSARHDYAAYRASVDPFRGRRAREGSPERIEVHLPAVWRTIRDAAVFFAAPAALLAVAAAQDSGLLPVLLHLP